MKPAAAQKALSEALITIYSAAEAEAIAELALEGITGYDRAELRTKYRDTILDSQQLIQLEAYKERLLLHEPIQYVTQRAWFYGMELYVNPAVLIPRPETEELADWIISDLKALHPDYLNRAPFEADKTSSLKILDIGTGSGCIALGIKKNIPVAEVWGCDCSESALTIARRNSAKLDIRVDFQGVDFLDAGQRKLLPSVDLIVSNPPYIPRKDMPSMDRNVLDFEPHTALFVPDDNALVFYKAIADFTDHRLHANGRIYLEVHEGLAGAVAELFRLKGFQSVEIRKDMQGKERMIRIS